jgi:putative transposase
VLNWNAESLENHVIKAHKIRLHPTDEQKVYFAKAAGTARFVWNWALAEWNQQYQVYAAIKQGRACPFPREAPPSKSPSALALKKQFNEIRRAEFAFTWEVTKNACDQPFLDLAKAFAAFFKGNAKRPRFKARKKSRPSFYLANDQFELGDHRIWIPKLGWVNMAEKLRFSGKITGARITRAADWWFISIVVEIQDASVEKKPKSVGLDVGLNRLATLSTGEGFENQKFLKTALKKLRQAQKHLSRSKKGSKNRERARRKVARIYYRISCLRDDILHKLTTKLASEYGLIGIEAIHIKGLMQNRRLARSFSDAALSRLISLLTSKVTAQGGMIVRVDRFFPSTQTCHSCSWRWLDITLSDRMFVCQNPACTLFGATQDRDENAAKSILKEALRLIGLVDQAVLGSGSDGTLKSPADLG